MSIKFNKLSLSILFSFFFSLISGSVFSSPSSQLYQQSNPLTDLINSVNDWRMTEELKLVIKELQEGNRERAKLRLGRYLSIHKNEPHALNIAGLILLEEGKYKAAEESFDRLLKQGVKNSKTFTLAGVCSYMRGNNTKAKKLLNEALSLNSNQALALRYLALIENSTGNYEAAASLYKRILAAPHKANKNRSKIHLNLADALVKSNKNNEAIKIIQQNNLVKAYPLKSSFILALAYANKGDFNRGLSILNKVKNDNNIYLVTYETIQLHRQFGQLSDALALNKDLIEKFPGARAQLYFQKGSIYAQDSNFRLAAQSTLEAKKFSTPNEYARIEITAAEYFKQSENSAKAALILRNGLKREPSNNDIKYALADLLIKTKGINESKKLLEEITLSDKGHFKAHYLIGVIDWNKKNIAGALQHFNQSVNSNPQFIDGWLALSQVEHQRSNDKKMLSTLETGLQHNPNSAALRYQLAGHAFSAGDSTKVIQLLKDYPINSTLYGDATSLYLLAMIDQKTQPEKINTLLSKAKAISPKNLYLKDAEGYFLALNGHASKATSLLKEVVKIINDDPIVYLHLVEALLQENKINDAKIAFQQAISFGLNTEYEKKLATNIKNRL